MTKKQLEKLIVEQTKGILNGMLLKESSDGWDRNALQDLGLMDWFKSVEEVAYDIRNCVRGAYCKSIGSTYEELGAHLLQLANDLKEIAYELDQGSFDEDNEDEEYYL